MKPTPPPFEIRGTADGYAVDAPNGDKDFGYDSWNNLAEFYGSYEDPESGDFKALANATMFVKAAESAERVKELEQENAGLYMLIVRLREAAGDKEGRLMQDELIEHIAELAKPDHRLNNGG